MKVTPKHLAYGSVLAVGGLALLLDSALPPASAAAAIEPTAAGTAAEALANAANAYSAPLDSGLAPLADRLAQLNTRYVSDENAARDVFAIDGPAWGLQSAPKPTSTSLSVSPQSNLRLTAIMANDGVGVAVINGRMVRVGDFIGGMWVQRISPRSVVLELEGRTQTLSVER